MSEFFSQALTEKDYPFGGIGAKTLFFFCDSDEAGCEFARYILHSMALSMEYVLLRRILPSAGKTLHVVWKRQVLMIDFAETC